MNKTKLKLPVDVDECLIPELLDLKNKRIKILGSCCGHRNPKHAYIAITNNSINKIQALDYVINGTISIVMKNGEYRLDDAYTVIPKHPCIGLCGKKKPTKGTIIHESHKPKIKKPNISYR